LMVFVSLIGIVGPACLHQWLRHAAQRAAEPSSAARSQG